MQKPNLNDLQSKVEEFNSKYQIGDVVEVKLLKTDHSPVFTDKIRSEASILGGHTPVVWLKKKGSYDITHVVGLADKD